MESAHVQLRTIKERLEKLAKEREQLLEYQRLDKKRKAIEFCILDHDRVKIVKELNEVWPAQLCVHPLHCTALYS